MEVKQDLNDLMKNESVLSHSEMLKVIKEILQKESMRNGRIPVMVGQNVRIPVLGDIKKALKKINIDSWEHKEEFNVSKNTDLRIFYVSSEEHSKFFQWAWPLIEDIKDKKISGSYRIYDMYKIDKSLNIHKLNVFPIGKIELINDANKKETNLKAIKDVITHAIEKKQPTRTGVTILTKETDDYTYEFSMELENKGNLCANKRVRNIEILHNKVCVDLKNNSCLRQCYEKMELYNLDAEVKYEKQRVESKRNSSDQLAQDESDLTSSFLREQNTGMQA